MTESGTPEFPAVPNPSSATEPPLLPPPPVAPTSAPNMPPPSGDPWPTATAAPEFSSPGPYAPPAGPYAPPPYAPVVSAEQNPDNAPVRVGFVDAIKRAYSRYAKFSGRASRSEYWWFYFLQLLVGVPLGLLAFGLGSRVTPGEAPTAMTGNLAISGLGNLWSLANFIPLLAVSWRRLHDSNKSGWWYGAAIALQVVLIMLVVVALIASIVSQCSGSSCDVSSFTAPSGLLLGLVVAAVIAVLALAITILVFLLRRGEEGSNKYGPGYANAG